MQHHFRNSVCHRAALRLLASARRAVAAAAPPPRSPKAGAPIDLTGYWVSIVTEDWRWRMVTPPKGDSASVPMTQAAQQIVDAWDPAKDEAAGHAVQGLRRAGDHAHSRPAAISPGRTTTR